MPWVWRCEFIGIQKSWLIVIIGIPKSWDYYFCGLWLPGKVLMDGVWGRMRRIQGRKQAPWVVPVASRCFDPLWVSMNSGEISKADSRTSQIYTQIIYDIYKVSLVSYLPRNAWSFTNPLFCANAFTDMDVPERLGFSSELDPRNFLLVCWSNTPTTTTTSGCFRKRPSEVTGAPPVRRCRWDTKIHQMSAENGCKPSHTY